MIQNDIRNEIRAVIDQRVSERETVQMSWLVRQVLHDHGIGPAIDFPSYCAHETVWRETREVLRKMKGDEAEAGEQDRQAVLPGFVRLQRRYVVERDNEQVVVPLELMADGEVSAKATELRSMAEGCLLHASELEDYLRQRPSPALVG